MPDICNILEAPVISIPIPEPTAFTTPKGSAPMLPCAKLMRTSLAVLETILILSANEDLAVELLKLSVTGPVLFTLKVTQSLPSDKVPRK
jgi:hypothetical protein